MRSMGTLQGRGDRLRSAAFAELQAERAFIWAAERFPGAPARGVWLALAEEEKGHFELILARMKALGVDPSERPVSNRLWESLVSCATIAEFSDFMRRSEERGRQAELRFQELLASADPETAALFSRIAADEARHIELAR